MRHRRSIVLMAVGLAAVAVVVLMWPAPVSYTTGSTPEAFAWLHGAMKKDDLVALFGSPGENQHNTFEDFGRTWAWQDDKGLIFASFDGDGWLNGVRRIRITRVDAVTEPIFTIADQ